MLIAFRVLQGLAGGGLQPSSQGVLLDAFPPEKQGTAHDALRHRGAARARRRARRSAATSPTTTAGAGSSISTCPSASSRFSCAAVWSSDPDYLKARARRSSAGSTSRFDTLGLCLLSADDGLLGNRAEQGAGVGLVRRSVLPRADARWLCSSSAWSRLICRELRIANPLINFRTLARPKLPLVLHHHLLRLRRAVRQHHHAARRCCSRCSATTRRPPAWCFRRRASSRSLVLLVVGALLGRGVDARYLMAAGLLTLARRQLSGCRS